MPITTPLPLEAARQRLVSDADDTNGSRRRTRMEEAKVGVSASRMLTMAELRNELVAKNSLPNRRLKQGRSDSVAFTGWVLIENVKFGTEKSRLFRREATITRVAGLLLSNEMQLVEYGTTLPGFRDDNSRDNLLGIHSSRLRWDPSQPLPCDMIMPVNVTASPDIVDPHLSPYTLSLKLEDLFAGMVVRHGLEAAQPAEI